MRGCLLRKRSSYVFAVTGWDVIVLNFSAPRYVVDTVANFAGS